MTELIFRYNPFYDSMLARLSGEQFLAAHENEGKKFRDEVSKRWSGVNDKVFSYYKNLGFVLPEFWIAYPVHAWGKLIPFDDPLTFIIKDDLEEVSATLIHELCHVFFSYYENKVSAKKIWHQVETKFRNEDLVTKQHLPVILLAAGGMQHIFGKQKTQQLLDKEKKYEGLERAWQILDSNNIASYENPIESIRGLK